MTDTPPRTATPEPCLLESTYPVPPSNPATVPPRPLDSALETIENVLTGMDWLGTGGSMKIADEEEREAWQAWDAILIALGRPGDSRTRVYGEPHDD